MAKFRDCLTTRIAELTEAHANYKKAEAKATDETVRLGYNSQAAGIWDTKTEIERVLADYDNGHPAKQSRKIPFLK